MKTIAKRIIGALGTGALIAGIIIGANAHDKKEEIKVETKAETEEWHFDGALDPADNNVDSPSQYSKGESTSCNNTPETVCNLNAPASSTNPNQPDLGAMAGTTGKTVSQRINDAISSGIPNETVTSFRSE
jgi:hypothetical protein